MNFFCYFFVIFMEFSIRHRVGTKRNDNFLFSLFPILFQPILAWNEFVMVFFNFFNFFLFFWNFLLRVGQERNGWITFIFAISHHFRTYYGLKWIHNGIFLVFFLFFLNFLLRDGKERNGTIIFILSHSHPFPTYFRQKCCHIFSFLYFEFWGYFFEILYYALGRNETER